MAYIYYNDFWEYDPAANAWTQKADFGGGTRQWATGFSIGGKGYVGCGRANNTTSSLSDFWEYDPSTDTWSQKAGLSLSREQAKGFSIGNKGYIGPGHSGTPIMTDFRAYDPSTNAWTSLAPYPGQNHAGMAGFSIGTLGFMGCQA